jgi:urease gamma subunit
VDETTSLRVAADVGYEYRKLNFRTDKAVISFYIQHGRARGQELAALMYAAMQFGVCLITCAAVKENVPNHIQVI